MLEGLLPRPTALFDMDDFLQLFHFFGIFSGNLVESLGISSFILLCFAVFSFFELT